MIMKRTRIEPMMALTSLLTACCLTTLIAVPFTGANLAQEPQIYVVQDEPQQVSNSNAPRHWNNQRLTLQQRPANGGRQAKQLMYHYGQKPVLVPYQYGSYELMTYHEHPATRYQHFNSPYYNSQWQQFSRELSDGDKSFSSNGIRTKTKGATARGSTKTSVAANKRRHFFSPAARGPINGTINRAFSTPANNKKNLVCYYGTWAVYRPDAGKFPVENIDPFLCTHIIYGFTGLSYDNLIKPLDPWNDLEDNYGKGAMKRFTNLKRINPDLKTLVAIGGWNEGSIKYSKMASEPESRAKFVRSVVDFLEKYNFDGLDLDWEYPGSRGGHSNDKTNFVKLLRELKQAFEPHGYLLTAAVSAGKWFIDPAYDIGQVSKYLDLINLMAYDYHGGWETKTGHNAPLFHSPKHDLKDEALLNVNWSVNYWLQKGAPAEKIMLGVGSYGRSFTLDRASENGINAPASQKGQAGPYTREPGSLGYNEICESFQRQPQSWTIVRHPDYLAPYAYNDRQWVGYDDMESLALKAQFAKSMGLGGVMMWSIETDDFSGRCHNQKYPLLKTIKRVLNGGQPAGPLKPPASTTRKPVAVTPASTSTSTPGLEVEEDPTPSSGSTSTTSTSRPDGIMPGSSRRPITSRRPNQPAGSSRRPNKPPTSTSRRPSSTTRRTTTSTTTTTTTTTTTEPPSENSEFVCRGEGMFADPQNCRKFIRCVNSGGQSTYSMFRFDCGPGTAWNGEKLYCDHIYNVPNCN